MAAQTDRLDQSTLKKGTVVEGNQQVDKLVPEKTLFQWRAPSRPFKRRDRDFWMTVISIAGIFCLILFFVEGIMPVIMIISVIFLFYVLSTVEPEEVEYTITNKGVKIGDKMTDLEQLRRFWFTRRFSDELLVFETFRLPGRLELVVDQKDKEKIRKALSDYLVEEEAAPSSLDRVANWFTKKLPQ
jgi:hypothetical protein